MKFSPSEPISAAFAMEGASPTSIFTWKMNQKGQRWSILFGMAVAVESFCRPT